MHAQVASCVVGRREFFGTFEIIARGPSEAVRVWFQDESIDAETGGLPVRTVAETLLKNLVTWTASARRRS